MVASSDLMITRRGGCRSYVGYPRMQEGHLNDRARSWSRFIQQNKSPPLLIHGAVVESKPNQSDLDGLLSSGLSSTDRSEPGPRRGTVSYSRIVPVTGRWHQMGTPLHMLTLRNSGRIVQW